MKIKRLLLIGITISLLVVAGIYLVVLPSLVHSLPTSVTPQQVIKASDKAFGGKWSINIGISGNTTVLQHGTEKVTYLNNRTATQPCSFYPQAMISQEYFLIYNSTKPLDGGYFRIYEFNNSFYAENFFNKELNTTMPVSYKANFTLGKIKGEVISFANSNITLGIAIYGKYVYLLYMYYFTFNDNQFITFINSL
ncbi:hypothetical protein CM19_00490 [Candidatus Acidianus copahuensis]|uniref:Uncharacterized protein n=1 Tax=Candidatus Acidianus copahuensis TaxID=1160895 RepID=A0A031LV93_9CREN|nr:hypothetical protein [Candidatus Acidianus copahuensis]EZQ11731.1 hypothetical protein CM19_00490 [Candidatus Acidianus copahuensis]